MTLCLAENPPRWVEPFFGLEFPFPGYSVAGNLSNLHLAVQKVQKTSLHSVRWLTQICGDVFLSGESTLTTGESKKGILFGVFFRDHPKRIPRTLRQQIAGPLFVSYPLFDESATSVFSAVAKNRQIRQDQTQMVVSTNGDTPKWLVHNGKSY